MTTEDRFWEKVDKAGDCWLWIAGIGPEGYGRFGVDGKTVYAHRYAYELISGSIPVGLQIDHLCRVRHCVNPRHLEAVTQRENILRSPVNFAAVNARKTHCSSGHPFDSEHSRIDSRGYRECVTCRRRRDRATYRRRVEASS